MKRLGKGLVVGRYTLLVIFGLSGLPLLLKLFINYLRDQPLTIWLTADFWLFIFVISATVIADTSSRASDRAENSYVLVHFIIASGALAGYFVADNFQVAAKAGPFSIGYLIVASLFALYYVADTRGVE